MAELTGTDLYVISQALSVVVALDASGVLDEVMDLSKLATKCVAVKERIDTIGGF
jgi:hypothetical protein